MRVARVDQGNEFLARVNARLVMQLGSLRRLVKAYMHEGRLQTFEDRERFREDAKRALEEVGDE